MAEPPHHVPRWLGLILLPCLFLAATARADDGGSVLLDDFERASVAPWTFDDGSEFPGAAGSLTLGGGHSGSGAALAYDFSHGGNYVGATLALTPGLEDAGILSLWLRVPAGVVPAVRLTDNSGQTLQYIAPRPLESLGPGEWYLQSLSVDTPTSFFGGSNDGKPHFPFVRVELLADDLPGLSSPDTLGFDELSVAPAPAESSWDPRETPATLVDPDGGASDCQRAQGVNIHFTHNPAALAAAADAGFVLIRQDLAWSGVETKKGTYNFAAYDTLVTDLAKVGMRAHFIFDYGNALYTGSTKVPPSGGEVTAFANFVQAATAHYQGKHVTWEVWNEPNIGEFWNGHPDAGWYATVAKAAIAAAHMGDSTALVSTAGLSTYDFDFANVELAKGAATGANAVGIHPYRQTGPETETNELVSLRKLAGALPVWETEWGYSTIYFGGGDAGTQKQALFASRAVLTACAEQVPMHVWYDLINDGTDPGDRESNFGLLNHDLSPKPAFLGARQALSAMRGRRFVGAYAVSAPGVEALQFVGADLVAVAWCTAPGASAKLVTPAPTSARDIFGRTLTPKLDDAGFAHWVLTENGGPIYLSYPAPPGSMEPPPTSGLDGSQGFAADGDGEATSDAPRVGGACGCTTGEGWSLVPAVVVALMLWRRRQTTHSVR